MSSFPDAYHAPEPIIPSPGSQFTLQIEIKGAPQHEQWMWVCYPVSINHQQGPDRAAEREMANKQFALLEPHETLFAYGN